MEIEGMVREPRYFEALASKRLAEVKAKVLEGRLSAGSHEAWILFFEAAEAAAARMSHRAATLHALANVLALGPATGGEPTRETLVDSHYEAMDDGREDLRIVDAAKLLAEAGKLEGFSSSEEAARSFLTSHGLSRAELSGKVVRMKWDNT